MMENKLKNMKNVFLKISAVYHFADVQYLRNISE